MEALSSTTARYTCALLAAAALVTATTDARADEMVSTGVRQYQDAEFEDAVTTLEAALATGALPRPEVARALGTLAAAEFALGHDRAMQERVATLAVVAPDYRFGPEIPPEIRGAFDVARATTHAPVLRIDSSGRGETRFVSTLLAGTRTGLREIVLECVDAHGRRERVAGPAPSLDVTSDSHCEASAVWVGGAVVASASSAVAADHTDIVGAVPAATSNEPPWLWIGVAIGAVVVVAAVIAIVAVAASSGPPEIQVSPPMVTW